MVYKIILIFIQIAAIFADNFYGKELFSTSTPYFWTRNAGRLMKDQDLTVMVNKNLCQAVYVDVLVRHGARYPTLHWTQDIDALESRMRQIGKISQMYPFLNSWKSPFQEALSSQLSPLGSYEQLTLGKRFSSRFQSLLNEYPNQLEFYATYKKRTKDSARHFQRGMAHIVNISVTEPTVDNIMLRFFDNCDLYDEKVVENKTAASELYKFANGPEISSAAASVLAKFSKGMFNVSTHDVAVLLYMCKFELAYSNASEWCNFFTEQDLLMYNYLNDLKNYWIKAYGHRLNYEISCPYFVHVFNNIDNAIANIATDNYTRGAFRFGHAETIAPIFAALGLFHDQSPLTADNYRSETNRLFRTSHILPFSSNLALVLYRCVQTSEYYVRLLVNEEDTVIPGCPQSVCPLSYVRTYLGNYINNCHFNSMCGNNVPDVGVFG